MFDVAIVGSGPGGASCAAFCALAGLRTLLLEREIFPREKVCGDCLNPSCSAVLEKLGLSERVRALAHGTLRRVDFIAIGGSTVSVKLPENAEIAVKRSLFDELLMTRAGEAGAEIRQGATVSALTPPDSRNGGWRITAGNDSIHTRVLVAADGRNSTVARLLRLLPRIARERVALQTHLPLPAGFGDRVVLQFLPEGYSGQAPIGNGELNLCLVGKPAGMPALRAWAETRFGLPRDQAWRTITPLRRAPLTPVGHRIFLVGDAARVVEPFTGEGIFYALRSGELAADIIRELIEQGDDEAATRRYAAAHENLYRGRLWINRIARAAVLSPHITSVLLRRKLIPPPLLATLTAKVIR
ncbi:MAG TPA: NAD(P)/FAD-dependent oxidoreductase [Chthoniobacterales bacterium]|nr:NAD(P)/FAD-dependent oxidoreductase [Chthoniobacterales bacterium]